MFFRSAISFRLSGPKGHFPSNAWSTMPSMRSPRVRSWYSANAFITLRIRFSRRTPVCTRSTAYAPSLPWYICTNVTDRSTLERHRLGVPVAHPPLEVTDVGQQRRAGGAEPERGVLHHRLAR